MITTLREFCRQFSIAMTPVIPSESSSSNPVYLEPIFTNEKCPVQLQIVSFGYLTGAHQIIIL